ncbi:FRG1-like family protein [Podospora conica]|nr:FRG1-like family protein [Schizothecium conicum]
MVKPLSFKGDKKPKKRKRTAAADPDDDDGAPSSSRQLKSTKTAAEPEEDPENPTDDDSWVSAEAPTDLSGPILLVLPTDPPTSLACDANGKVFTLPIENIIDGNPVTAEPHDVRQVWVVNRISGTEHFRFKGHHGKFLRCDKIGLLSATSDAISPLESFLVFSTADTPGTFQIQTLRDTFLQVKGKEVRGDAEGTSFDTTWRIRMQARFKPRLRASKEEKAREKIGRKELEEAAGRRLEEDEVKRLRRARREGDYHEVLLDLKVKSKHDKYG